MGTMNALMKIPAMRAMSMEMSKEMTKAGAFSAISASCIC